MKVLIKHIDHQLPRGLCVMSFCAVGQYKHHFQSVTEKPPFTLGFLPLSPPSPPCLPLPPPLSEVTVPPQRPLLCGAGPPPDGQMEGQASHSHRAIFSQPCALVLP